MRWPRRSSAWRVKPTTLIASTGNTQGIRFSIRPPSRAPSRAAANAERWRGTRPRIAAQRRLAAPAIRRLPRRHGRPWPTHLGLGAPALAVRRPAPPASPRGWRCAAATSGTRAVQVSPCQACVQLRARSRSLRRFPGRTPASCRAARPAGPATLSLSALPSICAVLLGRASGLGCASQAASKAGAVQRGGAARRHLQRELAFLGDAFLLAHQPTGLELDLQVAAQQRRLEVRRDGERHRQQHRALVAVVGQVPIGIFLGTGQAMSPAITPGGRVHCSCVGRPESPEFFQ